eukprot:scaffold4958_cov145-Skeletonema_marinoi.AAC.9
MSSLTLLLVHFLAYATLRLIYFYTEGIYGFERKESSRAKWEKHLKKIWPHVSEEMLEEEMFALKESLKNLTNPASQCTGGDETKYAKNETDSDSTEDNESEESTEHEASKMNTEHSPKTSANTVSEKKLSKKCVTCETWKPQTDFTASQWKKNADTVKCSACVSKLSAYQAPKLKIKICCSCGVSKAFDCFSFNQWRKKEGEGRCCDCVDKGTLDHISSNKFHT